MIKQLTIQNFQSHRNSSLELAPGVNVIVGASDSGKSAIIRALRWLIWNRPSGDAFRSTWGGDTKVDIDLGDCRIIRGKDAVNWYGIFKRKKGEPVLDETRLKAFGSDVPEEIRKVLNMDETNLQRQGDAHFLISKSPGEVSEHFNNVAKLDQIDTALKYITSQARSLTNQINSDESRLQNLILEAEQYKYIDKAEVDLEDLEEQIRIQTQRRSGVQLLHELYAGIDYLDYMIAEDKKDVVLEESLDELITLKESMYAVYHDLSALQNIVGGIKEYNSTIVKASQLLQIEKQLDQVITLREIVTSHLALTARINEEQAVLEQMEIDFHKYMPAQCPLCGK